MKVKVTNKMVKVLKEALPKDYEVKLVKFNPIEYQQNVHYEGVWFAQDWGDYDYKNNYSKVIQVLYPSEYYASPAYITTKDLIGYYNDAKRDGVVTIDSFKKALFAGIEV